MKRLNLFLCTAVMAAIYFLLAQRSTSDPRSLEGNEIHYIHLDDLDTTTDPGLTTRLFFPSPPNK
ncbi:hypothetical protein ACK8HY_13970 [Sphingobacterium sp. NGMCC 1.201703]|uniref:hypothetical protein n=1 Tax=Sphingobacterium sp. NGMCC 1.201703 TaxID=3388657 RepID=UPI0039FDD993